MRVMWCWRCQRDVHMLDEDEFAVIAQLWRDCTLAVKEYRQKNGASLADTPIRDIHEPARREYERITGMRDYDPNTIMHHSVAEHGPLCQACGTPLRSPKARRCVVCGHVKRDVN